MDFGGKKSLLLLLPNQEHQAKEDEDVVGCAMMQRNKRLSRSQWKQRTTRAARGCMHSSKHRGDDERIFCMSHICAAKEEHMDLQ